MALRRLSLGTVLLAQAWFTNADPHFSMFGGGGRLEQFQRQAALLGWEESHIAEGSDQLELRFWLKLTRAGELKRTLEDASDPNSPRYGHYLSKEQIDKMVAPTPQHLLAVREALQGFQLNQSNQGGIVSAKVTVEKATHILGGTFRYFCRSATPSVCVLRNPTAHVPATLRAACDAITPLDDPLPASPGPIVDYHAKQALAPSKDSVPSAGCCFSVGFGSLMQPCCLRTRLVDHKGACKPEQRLGGATGFHAGACPKTPVQASRFLGVAPTHEATALQMEGAADGAGCCFSVGFGTGMMPCCLEVRRVHVKAACHSGARIGGATGFRTGACPTTAADAAALLNVTQASKPAGCCFSIGYGDRMRPCCLSSKEVAAPQECRTEQRLGGATGFHAGSCPASADEAAQLIQQKNSRSSVGSDMFALKEPASEPQGCCFSIGYGDRMRPCCLSSKQMDSPEACNPGERLGGATVFHAGLCPASADEAANIIQRKRAPQLHSVANAQGCCYAIGYGAMMRPCCLQTERASNVSMCRISQRLGGATGYSALGCPTSATQASGWLGNEVAPEVALGEHSNGSNGGHAIIIGLSLALVSGILVTGVLIFARQRSAQDTAGSFQAYESPNEEEEEETRTPLRPTK